MKNNDLKNLQGSFNGLYVQKQWHLWFMLTIPTMLLGIIIVVFVVVGIQVQGIETDQIDNYVETRLPFILAINHVAVFGLLLHFLKSNSLKLQDLGWRIPARRLLVEILIGLGGAVALYLIKELVFDSIQAIINGGTPTFTSLFNFHFNSSALPMMVAATSLVFIEESIYRGFAINALEKKRGVYQAVVISSVFFGFLHWGNGIEAIIYTTVAGMLFALLYLWRDRNLITVTIAHGIYNLMILLA